MQEKRINVWIQNYGDRSNLTFMWIDPETGKRKSKSAETHIPAVAEMKRTELEYELNHGLHKEASCMSWEKFRELFAAEYLSGKRVDTRHGYADSFLAFERLAKPTSLRRINERTISAYVGALRRQPGYRGGQLQESTVKLRLQHLRTALRWAAKQKLIAECPAFPSIRPPKRKPQPVPVESFERMLNKAPDEQTRVFLLCGWLAGLRLNEAIALEREESEDAPYVDFAGNRIAFPAKTVKAVEDQWVPMDPELREAIEALPRKGRKVFHFVEERNGKPIGDIAVSARVREIGKAAGVRLTMKSLRRGFGCYWASRVPAQVLQKLMRHSNIRVTMDYYANVDDAAMQAILGRQRNTLRNSEAEAGSEQEAKQAANDSQDAACD